MKPTLSKNDSYRFREVFSVSIMLWWPEVCSRNLNLESMAFIFLALEAIILLRVNVCTEAYRLIPAISLPF